MSAIDAGTPAAVLDAFLAQHYDGRFRAADARLRDWRRRRRGRCSGGCSEQARRPVQWIRQPQGMRRSGWSWRRQNAQLALVAALAEEGSQQMRTRALADVLEARRRRRPRRAAHRVLRHQPHHGRGDRRPRAWSTSTTRCSTASTGASTSAASYRATTTRRCARPCSGATRRSPPAKAWLPDLVLIDGGKGQISVARGVFEELGLDIGVLVGVAKGEGRKVGLETLVFADGRAPLELGRESAALMLIAQIRDEAHRFAITGMRARRGQGPHAGRAGGDRRHRDRSGGSGCWRVSAACGASWPRASRTWPRSKGIPQDAGGGDLSSPLH